MVQRLFDFQYRKVNEKCGSTVGWLKRIIIELKYPSAIETFLLLDLDLQISSSILLTKEFRV
jgi:hypothetical protein